MNRRVAYVCADPGVPPFGCKGASVHVQEVLRAMRRRGWDVELFAVRDDGDEAADLRDLPFHALPRPVGGGGAGGGVGGRTGGRVKPSAAERERLERAANGALRAALEMRGPFDLVYERYSLWSFAAMEHAAERGLPGVLELNAPLIEEQATHRGLVDRAGAEEVARRAFRAARVLACVSRPVADWATARLDDGGPGWDGVGPRVEVIPNGVDPARFGGPIGPARVPAAGEFVVGFVGTLKAWHGLPVLAEAFALLAAVEPGARLLVVGDGPERAGFEADLERRGVRDAAILTGAVSPSAVPAWLRSMHVAVAPYPALAGFYFSPLKIFEYLAAGLPVVAGAIGQVTELLEDGVTGVLVPPGNAAALAGALGRLAGDELWRGQLGGNGRRWVERRHTWDAVVQRIGGLAWPVEADAGPGRKAVVS